MAVITNTFRTTNAVGNREELSDVVSRITPEDTPIYSLIEKGKCVSVHPEWETDDLAAPAENIREEGEDYTFDAITPPARLGNYTQIMRKDWIISGTQEVVSEAGNVQKRKYQKLKKGGERNTIIATADYYEGPFGTVMIHPNRVQAGAAGLARNAFFIDTEFAEFDWLRKIQEDKDVAKTGDADKGVIIGEGTLKVKNEKGLGVAADLFGLTAST
jgi:hypothetical protein